MIVDGAGEWAIDCRWLITDSCLFMADPSWTCTSGSGSLKSYSNTHFQLQGGQRICSLCALCKNKRMLALYTVKIISTPICIPRMADTLFWSNRGMSARLGVIQFPLFNYYSEKKK